MTELEAVGLLPLMVDEELETLLINECEMMGDLAVEVTVARRLSQGIELARVMGPKDILWKPSHNQAYDAGIYISEEIITCLQALAMEWGYEVSLLARTIIMNNACKPWEVRAAEKRIPFAPLRYERGRGNIYSMQFEMPGFHIVFLKLLGGADLRKDVVLGEALIALARQVESTGCVGPLPVSEQALEFAKKMVWTAEFRAQF